MKKIQEGSAFIEIDENSKVSKKLEVFYNPVMKLNRDLTVLLLNSIPNKKMKIADIMAGTGVRSIRISKELKKGKIRGLYVNDLHSIEKIKKNFKLNKIKANFSKEDANLFLFRNEGFDYIDIDPFGNPNEFLDSSIRKLSRNGILGVTATDTAVLAGTYPKSGKRQYWADTFRNGFMHESSLRILARKVQLIGAQYDKALIPIFSYAKEHYIRVFFKCVKGKEGCDEIIKQHKYVLFDPNTLGYEVSDKNFKEGCITIGPMYTGSLDDKQLVKKMIKDNKDKEAAKLLTTIYSELDMVGSYDLHKLCNRLKITIPKLEPILNKAKATRVHYNPNAIKTRLTAKELSKLLSR